MIRGRIRLSILSSIDGLDLSHGPFPPIKFSGQLRPSQTAVVEIAQRQLAAGSKRLHIVAPPGSGKTVLGLYLWAELVRKPCLVLSPNSAIQSQWAARTDLFEIAADQENVVSTDPNFPALLTSLTCQSVTLPARKIQEIDEQALELWSNKLIQEEEVFSNEEASIWIDDLRANNPDYFQSQFGNYKKKIRDEVSKSGQSISLLHESSKATLERLSTNGVGLIILDECHHLLGHWGRVLSDVLPVLNDPIVIGLTATPPERKGKDDRDLKRYDEFFGDIDFEVPVPAVVKDGFLAPYQDLAYFVRPTSDELKFIESADQRLKQLILDVCNENYLHDPNAAEANSETESSSLGVTSKPANIVQWIEATLGQLKLPTGNATNWSNFQRRDSVFALASRQFLESRFAQLPENVPPVAKSESHLVTPPMEYWVPVLDRFVRHFLRRSASPHHQQLAKDITGSLRVLGIQITETGTRHCASPVGRVMAYSKNKTAAIVPILKREMKSLEDSIRAVVIADFERSSAVSAQLQELMDDETGGAVSAFKTLLTDPQTDELEPVLITGSTVLIDDEIENEFLAQSRHWLENRKLKVDLESKTVADFRQIVGSGRDWAPRVYVEMVTELFQQGLTKCLIGTRGLLGEGWDANKINVLVDLTTVTTSMSINQLRGRSFRLDPGWDEKLANNWDVVCIAPEFSKGFDDYTRFKNKHKNLFGVTDDGAIEKGVGHVHPAFTELKPEGLESSVTVLNAEMMERSENRSSVRDLWKIGQPFAADSVRAVELKLGPGLGFPPVGKSRDPWSGESLTTAIATVVIRSLNEIGLVGGNFEPQVGNLSGGYVRVFLRGATAEENETFASSMKQILGPLDRPRYVIPRKVTVREETWLSNILPSVIGRYFQKSKTELAMLHAVPDALAKKKSDVLVFQKYWNEIVSPGEAAFAHRGQGMEMVEKALAGEQAESIVHEKEIFL